MAAIKTSNNLKTIRAFTGKIETIFVKPVSLNAPFIDVASRFANQPGTVVLMSGGGLDCAQYHILAIRPWLSIRWVDRQLSLKSGDKTVLLDDINPFDALRQVITDYALSFSDPSVPVAAGLFGYLSYDLKDYIEDLPKTAIDDNCLPGLCFFAPSAILIHDKIKDRTHLCMLCRSGCDFKQLEKEITESILKQCPPLFDDFSAGSTGFRSSFTQPAYMDAVNKIKDYIVSGDIYQVNLSQRFETDFSGNPFSMFKALYKMATGPFYAYINAGDHQVVSTSPERFLKKCGNDVETRPIKGTRPRGKNPLEDKALSNALLCSKKDDAELSMIVDLMRNDLGRVCNGGSVSVKAHKRLETYENVFHLVSVVKGKLSQDKDTIDLIRATFPGGSITGCPRIRAMEIIDELEPCRRHVYTGSIGYISFHDTMDLSIAIRTATVFHNKLRFSVGGGVVFDSDPTDEYEETLHKGRSLMNVLQSRKVDPVREEWVWLNGKLVAKKNATISATDLGVQYGYGFFETIRVNNNKAAHLADHINRFYSAWDNLFKTPKPDLTWEHIIRQVIEKNGLKNKTAVVKIMATHGDQTTLPYSHNLIAFAKKYSIRPALINKSGLDLVTYPHPRQTPMADYKTLNYLYYHLAGKWAQDQGVDESLILNPDGSISETNTANVLIIKGKNVIQPLSPHVLSGIMEKQVLVFLRKKGFKIDKKKIMPQDMVSSDQIILTNSLIGAVPVLSLDSIFLKPSADLCKKICGIVLL
ncbi:MAG: aminodeoxychorismate synthase component I [Dissulfuribacterales bacterium]